MQTRTGLVKTLLLIWLIQLLQGCAGPEPVDGGIVTDDCRVIWIWSYPPNHSEMILSMEDVSAGFWDKFPVSEIDSWSQYRYVGVGFFNIEYALEQRGQLGSLLSSPGGLWFSFYKMSPQAILPATQLVPIPLDTASVDQLVQYVLADVRLSTTGRVIGIEGIPMGRHAAGYRRFSLPVQANLAYNAFNFCHSWVLRGLQSVGFSDINPMIFTAPLVTRQLKVWFPDASQC